jgi:apolipoprotein N-acyltransferase
VGLEYLRSRLFGGFGWALLGYSQYRQIYLIQLADILGVYGISFAIIFVNLTLGQIISLVKVDNLKAAAKLIYTVAIVFIILIGYSFYRIKAPLFDTNFKAAVIQGNISRQIKDDPRARDYILEKYRKLTALAGLENPALVIWPETTVPGYLASDEKIFLFLSGLATQRNIFLLTGSIRRDSEGKYYNSAMLLSPAGDIVESYDKLHLVPFGEYVPLRGLFLFKPIASQIGDFSSGEDYTIFSVTSDTALVKQLNFGVLICFEDIFSHLARRFVQKGAQFLVVITNDVWFGDTAETYQHLQASVFRAVENKVMVVRAANTGISGFITPYGKIENLAPIYRQKKTFTEGYSAGRIFLRSGRTLYRLWGDGFARLCLLLNIVGFGLPFIRRKQH